MRIEKMSHATAGANRACILLILMGALMSTAEIANAQPADDEAVLRAAREQIERIRKGDFALVLADESGSPISGAAEIAMTRHAFAFGINLSQLHGAHARNDRDLVERAGKAVEEIYNLGVVTGFWQGSQSELRGAYDFSKQDWMREWARQRGLRMRYHCLIYNFHYAIPSWQEQVRTEEEWWPLIEDWLRASGEHWGDTIEEFDVINEMLLNAKWYEANSPIFPSLKDPAVGARIFELARRHFPGAKLICLEAGVPSTPFSSHIRNTLEYHKAILGLGAPVDAIGYQGHYHGARVTMAEVDEHIEAFRPLGKPVHITEFTATPANQNDDGQTWGHKAEFFVNAYTVLFSKPFVEQITAWHLIDNRSGLFDSRGEETEILAAMRKLLTKDWWTVWRGGLVQGKAAFRGFFGEYEIRAPGYRPQKADLLAPGEKAITLRRLDSK